MELSSDRKIVLETMNTEEELQKISERNLRVEGDKAWETSWTRRIFIAGLTYVIAGFWLSAIGVRDPWLSGFVPTGGYIISTLSLPILKRWWLKKQ
jgi:hypothetical protein